MLVLACGRGGRAALVHAVHRLCRGAEFRGGSGRADLIDQGSVRFIVGEPARTVEDREPAVRVFVNAHGTHLDRLARSTRDLLNTLASISDKQAGFRSLNDTWADTTTPHGRLM